MKKQKQPSFEERVQEPRVRRDSKYEFWSFPLFATAGFWLRYYVFWLLKDLERPAFIGQVFFFLIFFAANTILQFYNIDPLWYVSPVFFFAFDVVKAQNLSDASFFIFGALAFLLGWIVNKLVFFISPSLRQSSRLGLLSISFVSGVVGLVLFGALMNIMITILL